MVVLAVCESCAGNRAWPHLDDHLDDADPEGHGDQEAQAPTWSHLCVSWVSEGLWVAVVEMCLGCPALWA